MYNNDRYYEPEDGDDIEAIEEYVADWIAYAMRKGGQCDPRDDMNFGEAVSELGLGEELESWEQATEDQQAQITAYWFDIAEHLGTEAYYDNL